MDPTVRFVLVHGGATTARFWDRLLPLLDHPSIAVDLPGRNGRPADPMTFTVADGVAAIVADVVAASGTTGDLVLVAHSSGGLFVPGVAAALAPWVRHVVLSAASVPPEGGTGLECMKPSHRRRTEEAMAAARRDGWTLTTPGPPDDPEVMRSTFGGEPLDDETLAFVVDPVRAVRDSMHFYFQPVSWAAIADVPVTYVKNRDDNPIPSELQDAMIERLPNPVEVVELPVGHVPAVTHPDWFAAICNLVVGGPR